MPLTPRHRPLAKVLIPADLAHVWQVLPYATWATTRKGAQQAVAHAGGGFGARYNGRGAAPRHQGRPGKVFGHQPDGLADAAPGAKRRRCASLFLLAGGARAYSHRLMPCTGCGGPSCMSG